MINLTISALDKELERIKKDIISTEDSPKVKHKSSPKKTKTSQILLLPILCPIINYLTLTTTLEAYYACA